MEVININKKLKELNEKLISNIKYTDLNELKLKLIKMSKIRWLYRTNQFKSYKTDNHIENLKYKFLIMWKKINVLILFNWNLIKNEKDFLTYELMFTGLLQELNSVNYNLTLLEKAPEGAKFGYTKINRKNSYFNELFKISSIYKNLLKNVVNIKSDSIKYEELNIKIENNFYIENKISTELTLKINKELKIIKNKINEIIQEQNNLNYKNDEAMLHHNNEIKITEITLKSDLTPFKVMKDELKIIENKINEIMEIQNKNEIEKNLKEIYTYLDIKFQKQEKILKSLIKDELNIFKNKIPQNPQKDFLEKIIFVIKVIIFILLIFLIILFIIWLLIHLESFEPNIKIIETTLSEFPSDSVNNEGEKFKKSLFYSDEVSKLKFIKISFLQLLSSSEIWKRINISKGNFNENENLDNSTRIYDVLENYLGDNVNMLENESNENIINIVENILNNSESDPQDINNFLTYNNLNNIKDPENSSLNKSIFISVSMISFSIIISNIIPTLLEFIK